MYNKLKKYVEISPREFRGMVVLIGILLLFYVAPFIYERVMGTPLKISIETIAPKITDIEAFDEKKDAFYKKDDAPIKGELFNFNPNNLSAENWMKLGLTEKQVISIKKYEAKGGQFRSSADVKKMYAIKDEMYQRLEPYIQIPEKQNSYEPYESKPDSKVTFSRKEINVELNKADSVTLITVRGIGPSFASRILKYRNKLGGFISVNQLREIYGIDSAKFDQLTSQISIDANNINKIDINHCTIERLKLFPYLRYQQSNAIIAYRTQHGNFNNVRDLNKIAILSSELIQKITPYFTFND